MSQTTPPTITPAPAAPQRANRTTFSGLVDAFVTWLIAAVAQFQALATNCYNNAVDAFNSANAASGFSSSASSSATAAANSASAAAVASGVSAWVSGTTYAVGDCRYSPSNFWTYRRRTAGAGTTDPSADGTNWALISSATPGLQLLASLTPTAAATVDFLSVFTSTYDNYLIVIDGILPAADDGLTIRLANGGTVDSALNYGNGTNAFINLSSTVMAGGKGATATVAILNANGAGLKAVQRNVAVNSGASTYQSAVDTSFYTATSAVSGFRLYWGSSSSNFAAAGKVRVYGFANS